MAREVLSNGVINPDKYQADWYADLSNNWNLLNNLIGSAITSSQVDSKIATAIAELMVRTFQIVAELPQTGTEGVMYLILIPNTSKYTAYVWENSAYRELGTITMTITVDDELSTTSENPAQNKVITNALNGKANISHTHSASDITSGLATVATSGSYNDLSNKPTIPTKTSDLSNDSGFITEDNTKIPLAGTTALSGSIIPSTDDSYDLGDSTYGFKDFYTQKIYLKGSTIFKLVDDSFICLGGATAQTNGANLVLNGKSRSTSTGEFKLEARDGTNTRQLIGSPSGTLSWSGSSLVFTGDNSSISLSADASFVSINGGSGFLKGAQIALFGKDYGTNVNNAGACILTVATDVNNFQQMVLKPNGTLSWDGNVILNKNNDPYIGRGINTDYLNINGGHGWNDGGTVGVSGKNRTGSEGAGCVYFHPYGTMDQWMHLQSNGSWTWTGTACVVGSDRRIKDEITSISDDVLDAWESLEPKQYKYKSDLETDKENAQIHYGWIAQDVESIIKGGRKAEIKNGLWLHEEWEEQEEVSHEEEYTEEVQTKSGKTETVTKTRKVIDTPYKAKGDSYGLRYTECLVVECAFLRKKNKELQAQLDKVIARLDKLEGVQTK